MNDYTLNRIQRLELEIAELNARLIAEREMQHERCHEKLRAAVRRMESLVGERDRARDTAVALEQEIAGCPAVEHHAGLDWWESMPQDPIDVAAESGAELAELMLNGAGNDGWVADDDVR